LFGKEDEHFPFCGLTKEKRRATAMFDQRMLPVPGMADLCSACTHALEDYFD